MSCFVLTTPLDAIPTFGVCSTDHTAIIFIVFIVRAQTILGAAVLDAERNERYIIERAKLIDPGSSADDSSSTSGWGPSEDRAL